MQHGRKHGVRAAAGRKVPRSIGGASGGAWRSRRRRRQQGRRRVRATFSRTLETISSATASGLEFVSFAASRANGRVPSFLSRLSLGCRRRRSTCITCRRRGQHSSKTS